MQHRTVAVEGRTSAPLEAKLVTSEGAHWKMPGLKTFCSSGTLRHADTTAE